MYPSILADRTRFYYSQRSPVTAPRNSGALAPGSREAVSQTALFASGAMDSSPARQQEPARFRFEAPKARTVKLVADFTGWDKRPLDLRADDSGTWQLTVALPPGRYSYRFIVDGEWCDDPDCQACEVNPFGTHNAVMEVL
jgi:1,4-alpha-glucan branching enzyme